MKNIFRKKPSDKDGYKMEFADYALAVFVGIVVMGALYLITEIFF